MKRKKILILFPVLGLLLSGCTFQEGLANVKDWTSSHIFEPIKNLFNGGKKEEQQSGGDDDQQQEVTVKRIGIEDYKKEVEVDYVYKTSDVSIKVYYSDNTDEIKEPETVVCDTSKVGTATLTVSYKGVEQSAEVTVVEKGQVIEVDTGSLEAPLSISAFATEIEKVIDYSVIEENKSVTDPDHVFFVKGKVTSNYAPSEDGEIEYLNLEDPDHTEVKLTGYRVLVDESVTETITKDSLKGKEVVVKGYGALYNKKGVKTYEVVKKDDDNRAYVVKVETPPAKQEPQMVNKTLAEIVAGEPTKGQAYVVEKAKIKSWATNAGAAATAASQYGNMIITDGEHDVFVYGATAVTTDLKWNEVTGEYDFKNSGKFLENEKTKSLKAGDEISFYGIYFKYNTTLEMNIVITASTPGEGGDPTPPPTPTPVESEWKKISAQPEVGGDYKLILDRKDNASNPGLWFIDGKLQSETSSSGKDYYLTSSQNEEEAAAITLIEAEGGFKVKIGTRYLAIFKSTSGDKTFTNAGLKENEADGSVFAYNLDFGFYLVLDENTKFGLGTNNTREFTTVQATDFEKYPNNYSVCLYTKEAAPVKTIVGAEITAHPETVPQKGKIENSEVTVSVTYEGEETPGVGVVLSVVVDDITQLGEATATVTIKGYEPETPLTFKVTVVEDETPPSSELKQTIAYTGGVTTNMDGSNQASALGVTDTHISVVGTKTNGGQNNVGLNAQNNIRLYKKSTCTLTISIEGGTIVSIDVEIGATFGKLVVNGNEVSSAEAGGTSSVAINGTSAAITNSHDSNQTHIQSIVIHYTLNA